MPINQNYSKARLCFVFVLFCLLSLYVLFVFCKLSFTPIENNKETMIEIERGSILDNSGKPLAISANFYHVGVKPSYIADYKEELADCLAIPLKTSKEELLSIINNASTDFVYLKKRITETECDNVRYALALNNLGGVSFDEITGRVYPENSLASQVIGFMGDAGTGLSGIEYSMQSVLAPDIQSIDKAYYTPASGKGKNVYLTIDANLQYKLEKIAKSAMEDTGAESLMLIAAEAKTGEILSYISLPAANLNQYPASSQEEKIDRPAVLAYEPGSVFKIFSVASFVESGAISENDKFLCDGRCEIVGSGGEKAIITCLDHHGWVTAREALQYSCNDALAQMSLKINSETFLQYIRQFGFGSRTEIELPGETRGSVKTTQDKLWSIRSKPTISIGQEISVSALQMVQATTALTNGGTPVSLSLVSKITNYDGTVEYQHEINYKNPVISKATADYLLSCMETTARSGTGSRANISDVSIGVKTGTAQMLDPETGRYSETDFVSNCVAVFPIEDPEIILYIVINKAKGETYAGRIVAPVIGDAADVIIDHLGMARLNATSLEHSGKITIYSENPTTLKDVIPDFTGTPKRLLANLLNRKDIDVTIQGDGYVVSQYPAPGTPITKGMIVELYLE